MVKKNDKYRNDTGHENWAKSWFFKLKKKMPIVNIGIGGTVTPAICPTCGARHDGCTGIGINDDPPLHPNDGNFSICAYCGQLSVFYSNVSKLKKVTADTVREMCENNPDEARVVMALVQANRNPVTNANFNSKEKKNNKAAGFAWDEWVVKELGFELLKPKE